MKFIILWVIVGSALISILGFSAERPRTEEANFDISLYIENDTKGLSLAGSDKNYSNGLKISYLYAQDELPRWGKTLTSFIPGLRPLLDDPEWTFNFGLSLGQQIYTPEDIGVSTPIPNDRPYAGWLYLGFLAHLQRERWLHSLQVDFGVVGPPSLAEPTQKIFHSLIHVRIPQGWNNQLHTEPTLGIFYQQKYKLLIWDVAENNRSFELMPYAGAALGNVFIYGGAGVTTRVGWHLSEDFGMAQLSPTGVDPFVTSPNQKTPHFFEIYAFASIEGRALARNLFLDGNTFGASQSISKIPWVAEWEWGLMARLGAFRIAWRQVTITPEFDEEPNRHIYGSLSLTYSYRL